MKGCKCIATSMVLVCNKRPNAFHLAQCFPPGPAPSLPKAIKELDANIAPVVGPGRDWSWHGNFQPSKAVSILMTSMSVRDALIEINAALDEYLAEDEGPSMLTRFALTFLRVMATKTALWRC